MEFSASPRVTPLRLVVYTRSWNVLSKMMLMPVDFAIDPKMSRRLAWLNTIGAMTVFRLNSDGGTLLPGLLAHLLHRVAGPGASI